MTAVLSRQRRRNRLPNFDYSKNGWYFVTVCTENRKEYFGKIDNEKMFLNKYGEIAEKCWLGIPKHFKNTQLDEFIVMPNHIHGIVIIKNDEIVGNKPACAGRNFCSLQREISWQTKLSYSLSSVIRGFKIGVTKYFRKNNNYHFQWQKSFYDHIIRNEKSLNNIREYIRFNPIKWNDDEENPKNFLTLQS